MKVLTRMQEWADEEPFGSFTVLLSGGSELLIRHPELVVIDHDERQITIFDDTEEYLLSPLHVVGLRRYWSDE